MSATNCSPHSFSRYCLSNSRSHAKFRQNSTLQQFKVIQGPVSVERSLIVTLAYLLPFSRYWRLKIENGWSSPPLPSLTLLLGGNALEFQTYPTKTRWMGLPYGENFRILFSAVFAW